MRATMLTVTLTMAFILGHIALAAGQDVRKPDQNGGTILIPGSSIPGPGDAGNAGHTNVQIYVPPKSPPATHSQEAPDDKAGK